MGYLIGSIILGCCAYFLYTRDTVSSGIQGLISAVIGYASIIMMIYFIIGVLS